MFRFLIVIIPLVLEVTAQNRPLKEGSGCRLENRKMGVCRKLSNCPSAIYDVDVNDKWPPLCSFNEFGSVICCDELGPSTTPRTTTTTTTTTPQPRPGAGRVSREKCEEYSKWQTTFTLSTTNLKPKKKPGICGIGSTTFIQGGERAKKLEFPHMAHLGYGERANLSYECGGSLISEKFVMTAAHCMRRQDGTEVSYVRLGADDKRATKIVEITKKFPYPLYVPTKYYHDIALLELAEEVEFNDYVRPACLQVDKTVNDVKGIASGWGLTKSFGEASKHLMRVGLGFMNHSECIKTYVTGNDPKLPQGLKEESMVCAGELDGGKDTCNGDSGGPLQVVLKKPNCMYSIVGVTSFGIRCGIAPGVYTRVSQYVPWIESVVWPDD